MSIATYGPEHRWFAWHPVDTGDRGWRWLRFVWRRRCHLDVFGAPTFWTYRVERERVSVRASRAPEPMPTRRRHP